MDPSIHTYTISPNNPGVIDFYELEPEDLTEEVIRGGVTIEKRDAVTGKRPQGDASFAGIKFDIVNDSENPVVVNGKTCDPDSVAMTITTDAKGMATTGPNALPYGDYIIKESATNNSMQKTFDEEIPVTISGDGEMHTLTAENEVVRGGVAIKKLDSQTGATPQGNADFSGIIFEIVNRSANPVEVDGQTYATGAVVATLTTDAEGRASTADDALPFGRYEVRESATIVEPPHLIRRLTPGECELLQGYPLGWTDLPGASDSARYRALGNSVAIPCVQYVLGGIAKFAGV